jgi:hypothetical protein
VIGCERLCGRCDACEPMVWALGQPSPEDMLGDQGKWRAHYPKATALRAILDPSALAELLAQALRGRGVACATCPLRKDFLADRKRTWGTFRAWSLGSGDAEWQDGVSLEHHDGNGWDWNMPQARAALSRLLAGGLCGPEEALRLLEGP